MKLTSSDPTIQDILQLLRRGLPLALLVAVVAASATYLISRNLSPSYRARASVLVAQNDPAATLGTSVFMAPTLDVNAYQTALLSPPVLEKVLDSLDADAQTTVSALRDSINLRSQENRRSGVIHIDVVDSVAQDAAKKANALADALIEWNRDFANGNINTVIRALEQQIETLNQQIDELKEVEDSITADQIDRRENLRADQLEQLYYARTFKGLALTSLYTVQPATVPSHPFAPRPLRYTVIATALAVLLSYSFLLLRDALDTRLKNSADLAKASGYPVLAEFPKYNDRQLPQDMVSFLRSNLMLSSSEQEALVLLVISRDEGEDKSVVALNLAESFARSGQKTLLVDADLHKPVLGKHYNLKKKSSALETYLKVLPRDFLESKVTLEDGSHFHIVPSFEASTTPSTELISRGFYTRLETWKKRFGVIIIDVATLMPVVDALSIAPLCTGAMLVADIHKADEREVQNTMKLLERFDTNILGLVMMGASSKA